MIQINGHNVMIARFGEKSRGRSDKARALFAKMPEKYATNVKNFQKIT